MKKPAFNHLTLIRSDISEWPAKDAVRHLQNFLTTFSRDLSYRQIEQVCRAIEQYRKKAQAEKKPS